MSKLRSHWFAVFGGVTLLALSMSSAFAGKPEVPQGQLVSEFVHSLQSADESETESPEESEAESPAEPAVEDTEFSNHGECVKAVAQDKEAVGGDNENHGGAVSEAARVTCQDGAATDEAAADESDTEVESDADTASESESEAESEDAGHGKNHDKGGDSSDD
jgi:hypothetical protein